MRLDVRLLELTFAFVWQSGSFYKAAKLSGFSVMFFIHRMNLFENWLGEELYVKQKQQYRTAVEPTRFGYYFLCCFGNDRIYPSQLVSYRNW